MNKPLLFLSLLSLASLIITVSDNFYNDFDITWGNDHAQILGNGNQLQLTLDHTSYVLCGVGSVVLCIGAEECKNLED